jgi:penicillin-binding protein 2
MFLFDRTRRWRSPKRKLPPPESKVTQTRFTVLRLTVVAVFAILSLQLARLQLINGATYRYRSDAQRLDLVPVLPPRGLIYDRKGQLLVENSASYARAVRPGSAPKGAEADAFYRKLERFAGLPAEEIRLRVEDARRTRGASQPLVLRQDLNRDDALAFLEQRADLPGAELIIQPTRHYLEGPILSHVLGFVGKISREEYEALKSRNYEPDDRIGKTGVEMMYESTLRGTPGRRIVERDALGREVTVVAQEPAQPGNNLYLTIDADLQRKTSEFLMAGLKRAKAGAALVMDVRTGEMLAMVSLPSFDNNIFSKTVADEEVQKLLDDPAKPLLNHAISEMYPPGSIFKQITGIAALQEKTITPRTRITSRGSMYVRNEFFPSQVYVFPDWAVLGTLDFYGGIAMSSDIYFYCLAGGCGPANGQPETITGIGPRALARYARLFGLGEETGVDLPGEAEGIVPDPDWKRAVKGEQWFDADTYHMAIGQGDVTTTPLQMLVATAAIANGGEVLVPRLVREVRDAKGNLVTPYQPTVRRKLPIDSENFTVLHEAMRQAALSGTARPAAVPGVAVAGKTGTAEYGPLLSNGKYATHGWFAGYAPANDPEIAVIIFLDQGVGQDDAAPIAGRIFQYYFERQSLTYGR